MTIGPIVAADEGSTTRSPTRSLVVGTSDPSWTEKVCAMAWRATASLQLGFGIGKYTNRNVMDAYGGVSRGKEQWTVRASRSRLAIARPHDGRPAPLRGARADEARPVRARRQRRAARRVRLDVRGRRCLRRSRTAPSTTRDGHRVVGRPRPLPPDRGGVGLGGDRRRAHRARPRRLGLDPRPLVGRPLRRRPKPPPTPEASTRSAIRGLVPDDLVPASWRRADGSPLRADAALRRSSAPGSATRRSWAGSSTPTAGTSRGSTSSRI